MAVIALIAFTVFFIQHHRSERASAQTADAEFQRLREEHIRYAQRLDQLSAKNHLSEQEQIEEILLKKKKLRVKDEMEMMIRQAGSV